MVGQDDVARLLAATDPDATGGEFYGPRRNVPGRPVLTTPVAQSADAAFGAEFWRLAEEATGVTFTCLLYTSRCV